MKGRVEFSCSYKELYMHFTFMGAVLFNIFFGNVDSGIGCLSATSASFPSHTKLCDVFDMLREGCHPQGSQQA